MDEEIEVVKKILVDCGYKKDGIIFTEIKDVHFDMGYRDLVVRILVDEFCLCFTRECDDEFSLVRKSYFKESRQCPISRHGGDIFSVDCDGKSRIGKNEDCFKNKLVEEIYLEFVSNFDMTTFISNYVEWCLTKKSFISDIQIKN